MKKEDVKKVAVEYVVEDGVEPVFDNGLVYLKSPFGLNLTKGQKQMVKLGVRFQCPMVLYPSQLLVRHNVDMLNKQTLVMPGDEIVVDLDPKTDEVFEMRDTLCVAVPVNTTLSFQKKS